MSQRPPRVERHRDEHVFMGETRRVCMKCGLETWVVRRRVVVGGAAKTQTTFYRLGGETQELVKGERLPSCTA